MLTVPVLILYASVAWLFGGNISNMALLLPGLIAIPVYMIIPCLKGEAVPLSQPADEAKSAGRGVRMIGFLVASMALTALTVWAWSTGWFHWLLIGESVVVAALYTFLRSIAARAQWTPID